MDTTSTFKNFTIFLKRIIKWGKNRKKSKEMKFLSEDDEREVKERLKALGYLD